jgi:OPA family sugar phosphate sensor protein UhpC-like MFS transporter
MYVPGVICILGGFFLINRLRDTPQSLGLPPIEKYRNDYGGVPQGQNNEKELTTREILVNYIFCNKYIWILGAAYFFVYILRTGINDWTALYLREDKGYSMMGANGTVSIFDIGGFCGNLAAGWASDYFFRANRGQVSALFGMGILASLVAFWFIPPGFPLLDSIAMFALGFMIFGPQMLIGVAAAELSHKKAAATATGFIGLIAYLGAAFAGYPLGRVTQEWGWEGYFWFMTICSALAVFFLLPMWTVTQSKVAAKLKAKYA